MLPISPAQAEVLRGRAAIRGNAALLDAFVQGCEDADSLPSIVLWLRDVEAQGGVPLAALLYRDGKLSAVLLAVELTLGGWRTRLAFSGNLTGHCGFFASQELRADERSCLLEGASDALLQNGDLWGLLLSVKRGAEPSSVRAGIEAVSTRAVYDTFDLQGDFDASLAGLGAHTRRNLRYYRRRAEKELHTEFHSQLLGADLRDAVLDLRTSMPTELPGGVLKNRIAHVMRRPEAFCMGVRAADGRWLSWVSGWRVGRCTYIDWQCNRAELARYSVSTVMRSYLIEQESRRAQLQIRFLGGTPHTMHYGFREDACTDWLLTADSAGGHAMGVGLRTLAWLRRTMKPQPKDSAEGGARRRAPRRHRVASLVVRMVGTILRAEEA